MNETANRHRITRGIRFSFLMNLAMVGIAFGFAMWTRSSAILLDGFFSLIGVVEIIAVRAVAGLQWRPQDARHPFGFAAFMPLLNAIRGLLTIGVCGYAGVAAVLLIIDGGETPVAGPGVLYGVLAAGGCLFAAVVVQRAARETRSPLLEVDARSWWIDALYSIVVAIAFGVAMLMQGASMDVAARYVDPVLVLVLLALALPWPVGIVRRSFRELLLLSPADAERIKACELAEKVLGGLDPKQLVTRVLHSGGGIYLLCHVLMDEDRTIAVRDLDQARDELTRVLVEEFGTAEVDLVLTTDLDACVLAD